MNTAMPKVMTTTNTDQMGNFMSKYLPTPVSRAVTEITLDTPNPNMNTDGPIPPNIHHISINMPITGIPMNIDTT
ncbi:hypothetical protein JCM14467A_12550 [Vulcanisaeta sp. JCM 14467]